jgi:hypothetical protein
MELFSHIAKHSNTVRPPRRGAEVDAYQTMEDGQAT